MKRILHAPPYRILVERLISLRKDNGLSQAELGAMLGLSQPEVSKIEKFERKIDILGFLAWIKATNKVLYKALSRLLQ